METIREEGEPEAATVWQTARADLAQATGWRALGVGIVLIWMAFQWGWGNDVLLPTIVSRTFEAIDDSQRWPTGFAAVGAATAVGSIFWGATQSIDVVIVLTGLGLIPGVTDRISRLLNEQGWVKPYRELSLGARLLIAYASGASALCLIDVFATGQSGLRGRRRMLVESVTLSVGTVAAVVVLVTSALAIGARFPASQGATEIFVRFARNPMTWIVFYGSLIGGSALIERLKAE